MDIRMSKYANVITNLRKFHLGRLWLHTISQSDSIQHILCWDLNPRVLSQIQNPDSAPAFFRFHRSEADNGFLFPPRRRKALATVSFGFSTFKISLKRKERGTRYLFDIDGNFPPVFPILTYYCHLCSFLFSYNWKLIWYKFTYRFSFIVLFWLF